MIYVNEIPFEHPQNKPADQAAAKAAETWRIAHANDPAIEPLFDERGKQTNYVDRSEALVADEPTYSIVQLSDGTVRKDNRQPPAPPTPPVTVKSEYRYTARDLAHLTSEDRVVSRCGGGQTIEKPRASS